jgi:50S ribosomal subunit-associated GTPase HflX
MRTTENVLAELELDQIPCIVVFNKADLLDPVHGKALLRGHKGSILLSATHRETTRALIEAIAEHLAERWQKSAKTPDVHVEEEEETEEMRAPSPDEGTTTLEAMLRAGGKRVRSVRV